MNYDNFLRQIGFRLKKQRLSLGLTQKQMADAIASKCDISDKQLSRLESGANATRLDKFVELCIALGKTPDYFLLGIDRGNETDEKATAQITEYLKLLPQNELSLVLAFVKTLAEK